MNTANTNTSTKPSKLIYFVRHAESDANVNPQARSLNPLTENGLQQAQTVANRFKHIRIERLIQTSKMRSRQTAEAISAVLNIQAEENDLFIERVGEFEAMFEHKHLPHAELTEAMKKKLNKEHWDYSKQELFEDLLDRVKKATEYLENVPEERIAVVTHGAFLKVFIAYIMFKDALTEELAVTFMDHIASSNTGITLCKSYTGTQRWRLLTWNDQSHLG